MCLLVMGFLALSSYAVEEKVHLSQLKRAVAGDFPKDSPSYFIREDLRAYNTYVKTIPNWGGSWFTVPYKPTDNITVQIVRQSEPYNYKYSDTPVLVLCTLNNMKCYYDNATKGRSLSFVISAKELNATKDDLFHFILYGVNKDNNTAHSVVVGLYICTGKYSLSTCTATCYKTCTHGSKSQVMNTCICYKGYTGERCQKKAKKAPTWKSDFGGNNFGYQFVIDLCGLIVGVSVFITIIVFIRACVRCRKMKLAQQANNNGRNPVAPPPPSSGGYAYYPLGTAPPPPPPSTATVIEMPSIVDTPKPVQVTPPVAPANQVPVFITPPGYVKN